MVACMCVLFAVTKFVALLYDALLKRGRLLIGQHANAFQRVLVRHPLES